MGSSVSADRGWKRPFEDPILLPRGRQLITLEDAGNYITKLTKAEHEASEWQAAMEALILVANIGRANDVRPDRRHARLEPRSRSGVQSRAQRAALGPAQASEGPMKTVFVYVNTSKQVGDKRPSQGVCECQDAAETWFEENDPEGVAFEYEVLE